MDRRESQRGRNGRTHTLSLSFSREGVERSGEFRGGSGRDGCGGGGGGVEV